MNELKGFQLRLVKRQSAVINFEQASVALLARFKAQPPAMTQLPIRTYPPVSLGSEWRDPVAWRLGAAAESGGRA